MTEKQKNIQEALKIFVILRLYGYIDNYKKYANFEILEIVDREQIIKKNVDFCKLYNKNINNI